jgi:hypothetical protein
MLCLVIGSWQHWTTQYLLRTHVGRCLSKCYCSVAHMVSCVFVHRFFGSSCTFMPIFAETDMKFDFSNPNSLPGKDHPNLF